MPIGIKFSQFIAGGNLKVTDKTVGIRDGVNTIFTDPSDGILDENGNYLLRYASGSVDAVNAVLFKNSATGDPAEISIDGSDTDASLRIFAKGNGSLLLETPSEGDITLQNTGNGSINLNSLGLGDVNVTTDAGKFILNETTGINAVLDEDNMASNSATAVSTQQSTKAYVDAVAGGLRDLTYITSTDETANAPNSFQLLGTANEIEVNDGVLSLPLSLTLPGSMTIDNGELVLASGAAIFSTNQDLNLVPDGGYAVTLQTETVSIQKDLMHELESGNKLSFTTGVQTYYIGGTEQLRINSSGLRVKSNLSISDSQISTASGDLNVVPFADLNLYGDGDVNLLSGLSGGAGNLSFIANGSGNFIAQTGSGNIDFNTSSGAYNFSVASSSVMDLTSSGFRLGMGYRVSSISNDAAAYLDTQLMTAYAVQTAIGNAIIGSNNFRGGWDASGGLFPTTGGTGPSGAVAAGNNWRISVGGTLGGEPVDQGDQIIAATAVPGQTAANWIVVNPRVFSVFGRTGSVVAQTGDYSYNQITGLPSTATSGKLMRGTGSAWAETTATYPDTVATNDLLRGSATNVISPLSTQNNSVLTTSEFGALRWTSLSLGQIPMGSFTSGVNAGTISGGTGLTTTAGTTSIIINLAVPVIGSRGGTGQTTTSLGDLLVGAAGNTWSKLATANSSYLATNATGVVGWAARSYARIYTGISAAAGNSLTFGVSPAEITGTPVAFTLDSLSTSDFSMSVDGRLRYTGSVTKTFLCFASFSCTNAAAGVLQIYRNGVAVTNGIGRGLLSGLSAPSGTPISLATNDYLSLFVNFISGSAAPSIYTAQLSVSSVQDTQ